jgi:hypothetical protein
LLLHAMPRRKIVRHHSSRTARMNQRRPLNNSRKGGSRCGASSFISVKYGAQKAHSSSLTSLGFGFLRFAIPRKCRDVFTLYRDFSQKVYNRL